jgi:hypothetical protein
MTIDKLLALHNNLCDNARILLAKKNHDYAGPDTSDVFTALRECERLGICAAELGILVRMSDKLSRLSTFARSGQLLVKDEDVKDTCVDLINYAVLVAALVDARRQTADVREVPSGASAPACSTQTQNTLRDGMP